MIFMLEALLAGIIQGLTEFLPVSSSGHLVIYQSLFGSGDNSSNLAFNVFLHLATLLAVIIVFRRDLWTLIKEFWAALVDLFRGKPNFKSPARRFLLMVVVATVPAVLVGAAIKILKWEAILENIFVVAVMLLVTATLMFLVDKLNQGKYTEAKAPLKSAWLVGGLQAVAILPGLSRSGTTIFAGLLGGFKKELAVRFAFILSIPTILGAALIELLEVAETGHLGVEPVNLVIGFLAAMICGILSIRLIKVLIKNNKFWIFGIYCLLVAGLAFLIGFGVI